VLDMLGGTSRQFPDYELPFDTPIQYRTIKADIDGNPIGSTFNYSATIVMISPAGSCSWWVHPVDDPTLIREITATADNAATFATPRGVQYGVNAQYPNVQFARRQARSGASFSVIALSNDDAEAIVDALGAPAVLCVRSPAAQGWARRYIAVTNIVESHPNPLQAQAWLYKVSYVESQRPTSTLEVYGATYDQLAAAFTTYSALQAGFADYDAQTLGIV
jgi:hypothetical protein